MARKNSFWRKLYREFAVLLSKLSLRKLTLSYHGTRFKIPIFDGIGRFHFFPDFGEWTERCLKINKVINSGRPVIDVGVNIGQFMLNHKSIDSEAAYHGFEPNPTCIFYCYELIRMNNFKNTYVYPVAIAGNVSVQKLHSSTRISGTSSLVEGIHDYKEEFSTYVITLPGDDLIRNIIGIVDAGLIKVDVEGFELDVLKGLENYISEVRPLLLVEIMFQKLPETRLRDIYAFTKKLEYRLLYPDNQNAARVINDQDEFLRIDRPYDFLMVHQSKLEQVHQEFMNF